MTADIQTCPGGTTVVRVPPDCLFEQCPIAACPGDVSKIKNDFQSKRLNVANLTPHLFICFFRFAHVQVEVSLFVIQQMIVSFKPVPTLLELMLH